MNLNVGALHALGNKLNTAGHQAATQRNSAVRKMPLGLAERSAAEKEIAKLIQRVFILPQASPSHKVVAFCGIEPGNGCSWVCAHSACELARELDRMVCVMDANLHSPSLHEHFHCENISGLADSDTPRRSILESVRAIPGSKISFIPSGSVDHCEKPEIFHPAQLRTMLSDLRNRFDFILIDTPPLSLYGDAIRIGQVADGIVLVVESNSTRRETARAAKESLEAANVPVLGAILNRRSFPIPKRLYQRL